MSKHKTLECHDCGAEIHIVDKYEDIAAEDLKYCPLCGSENILIVEIEESTEE